MRLRSIFECQCLDFRREKTRNVQIMNESLNQVRFHVVLFTYTKVKLGNASLTTVIMVEWSVGNKELSIMISQLKTCLNNKGNFLVMSS